MSGRSRSLATMLFFEAQLLGMDEVPDRAIIDLKAPLGKLGNQPTYCEVLLPDPLQKPLAMLTGNRFWLVATHLAGGNAAGLAHPTHPIDHRTDAQTKLRRRPVARQPTLLNRRDYTLTKIKRIWSAHRMLASNPASILNQNQPDLGIPIRFRLKSSRFRRRNPLAICQLSPVPPENLPGPSRLPSPAQSVTAKSDLRNDPWEFATLAPWSL